MQDTTWTKLDAVLEKYGIFRIYNPQTMTCNLMMGDEKVGYTTSGTKCPFFDYPIAMARIPREYKEIGTKVQVDVRGRMVDAEVCELPFYKR